MGHSTDLQTAKLGNLQREILGIHGKSVQKLEALRHAGHAEARQGANLTAASSTQQLCSHPNKTAIDAPTLSSETFLSFKFSHRKRICMVESQLFKVTKLKLAKATCQRHTSRFEVILSALKSRRMLYNTAKTVFCRLCFVY